MSEKILKMQETILAKQAELAQLMGELADETGGRFHRVSEIDLIRIYCQMSRMQHRTLPGIKPEWPDTLPKVAIMGNGHVCVNDRETGVFVVRPEDMKPVDSNNIDMKVVHVTSNEAFQNG